MRWIWTPEFTCDFYMLNECMTCECFDARYGVANSQTIRGCLFFSSYPLTYSLPSTRLFILTSHPTLCPITFPKHHHYPSYFAKRCYTYLLTRYISITHGYDDIRDTFTSLHSSFTSIAYLPYMLIIHTNSQLSYVGNLGIKQYAI